MSDAVTQPLELTNDEKNRLIEKKATCPFIGSVVAEGALAVRNSVENPLASVEDVRTLGNSGGGDLGDLLALFASGNHAFMGGSSGRLDQPVPSGLFSLEFPGSQGSHPGHSGILEGAANLPGSGRFSPTDFERLIGRGKNGLIKRSDIGLFIAENLHKDPEAKVFGNGVAKALVLDLLRLGGSVGDAWTGRIFGHGDDAAATHRDLEEKLTKLLGEDNLVGSAGEFGLLFALVANKPGAVEVDGEPTVAVADLHAMFVEKRLPDGWETWKKSRIDWVRNTAGLLLSAGKEYLVLIRQP